MNEFIKGSSKPKENPTLKSLISHRITSKLTFRNGSQIIQIRKVSDVNVFAIIKGDYLDSDKTKWNYEYKGEAQLTYDMGGGIRTDLMSIRGYAQIDENILIKLSNEVHAS